MQQFAQALEFANQVLDLRERGARDALDQRGDAVDGCIGIDRGLGRGSRIGTAQIRDIITDEIANAGLDFGDRSQIRIQLDLSSISLVRTNHIHRPFPHFAFKRARCPRTTNFSKPMSAAKLGRTAAKPRRRFDHSWRAAAILWAYQLRLKPAEMLLLVPPCAVSPIAPDTERASVSFC